MTAPGRTRRSRVPAIVTLLLVGVTTGCGDAATTTVAAPAVEEILVAAASDLRPAFELLGSEFSAATGTTVTFSFGSSGQLAEQIVNGAPFDLFASANVEFVDRVIAAGRGQADAKADYAVGRIVIWVPDGEPPTHIEDLTGERFERVAIANPDHAPYGLAAMQALETAGIHDELRPRLVYGQNISDTFQIAKSGNVDAAIIALSLAIADGSEYTMLPADLHEPLRQALVVTSVGARGGAARAFAEFVASPEGREVMVRFGFVLPGEGPVAVGAG